MTPPDLLAALRAVRDEMKEKAAARRVYKAGPLPIFYVDGWAGRLDELVASLEAESQNPNPKALPVSVDAPAPQGEGSGIDIVDMLRSVVSVNGSQKAAASALCISPQYLCDLLAGRREVSAEVAEALGCQRIVTFIDTRRAQPTAVANAEPDCQRVEGCNTPVSCKQDQACGDRLQFGPVGLRGQPGALYQQLDAIRESLPVFSDAREALNEILNTLTVDRSPTHE